MPQISSSDVTQVDDGPEADTVIVQLSDSVGLLGVIRNNDQSLAQVVLVSVPGDNDAAANQLYQSAFDVLVRTLAPALDEAARTELAGQLGLSNTPTALPRGHLGHRDGRSPALHRRLPSRPRGLLHHAWWTPAAG